MATIRKRGDFQWEAQIRNKGFPSESKTFTYRADAEAWARAREAERERGLYLPLRDSESTTFDDLAKSFEKDFAPHHYRGAGWKHKLKPLRAAFGKHSLLAITPLLVAKYRDDRLAAPDPRFKDRATAPRVSGATVKTEIDLLSKMVGYAMKEREIALPAGNPVTKIRKPTAGQARDRRLVDDEAERLIRECEASTCAYLTPAVRIAIETAMRQGELLNLQWKSIDFKRRLALLLDPDKIKNRTPRAVPLSSAAIAVLEGLPRSIKGKVFAVDKPALYGAFKRACARAGIEGFTWHDLRHEALSRLAERGDISMLELAAISGHKTLQMLKRYTHLHAEDLARKLG